MTENKLNKVVVTSSDEIKEVYVRRTALMGIFAWNERISSHKLKSDLVIGSIKNIEEYDKIFINGEEYVKKEMGGVKPIKIKEDVVEEVEEKKDGRKNNKIIRKCKVCGKVGCRADRCPENKPENYGFKKDGEEPTGWDDTMKEEINEMLAEGQSTRDVAKLYGVDIRTANRFIAKAKGIKLPSDNE